MKVMHVLQSGNYSGAENIVIQLIKLSSNESVESIYVSSEGPIRKVLEEKNISNSLITNFNLINIHKVIQKFKPDIIHAHDFQATVLCAILKKKYKLISHIHANPEWLKKLNIYTLVTQSAFKRCEKVIMVSEKISDSYIFQKSIQNKLSILENPVDIEKIKKMSLEPNKSVRSDVIFIGRLEKVKNPIAFIMLINEIKTRIPNIRAIMLGEGSFHKECQSTINELNLNENIVIKGFVDNPYKYIKNSKVLVITSISEGYSLVAVESLIIGTPIVSFDVGEVKRIVDDTCGIVSNNKSEIIEEINLLVQNESYLNTKKNNCTLKVMTLKSLESIQSELLRIYHEI